MLRPPRDKFVASGDAEAFKKIVQSEAFESATLTAMLELEREMPLDCPIPQQACDAHQQMAGARKYLEILCSLHQPPSPTRKTSQRVLNEQAGV